MSKIFSALCLIGLSLPAIGHAQVRWYHNIEQARQVAQQEDKLLVLHFWAAWCKPCMQLETFVFTHPQVIETLSSEVIAVKLDIDRHPDLVKQYSIRSIPADIIVCPQGKIVSKRTSPNTIDGYSQMVSRAVVGYRQQNEKLVTAREMLYPTADFSEQPVAAETAANHFARQHIPPEQPWGVSTAAVTPHVPAASVTVENHHVRPAGLESEHRQFDRTGMLIPATPPFVPIQMAPPNWNMEVVDDGMLRPILPGHMAAPRNPRELIDSPFSRPSSTTLTTPDEPIDDLSEPKMLRPLLPASSIRSLNATATAPPIAVSQPLGLEGYCPVTLAEHSIWSLGDQRFGCIHRGRLYLFTSAANRDRFFSSPDDYSPLLSGYDPVALHEHGRFIEGRRSLGVFFNDPSDPSGRSTIVLFASEENQRQFTQSPENYFFVAQRKMQDIDRQRTAQTTDNIPTYR